MAVARVGLLRALLASHALSTRNRMARDLGRSGRWGLVVLLVFLLATAILPTLLGLGASGYALGLYLPGKVPTAMLGGLFSAVALMGGVVSGTLGGTRQLAWESYRGYPVPLRTIYVAELLAGLADIVPMLIGAALASLLVGLAIARPRLALLAPFAWVEAMAFVLVLQVLVGSLAASLVKRLRMALLAVAALAWVGSTIPAMLTPGFGTDGAHPALDPEQLAKLARFGELLRDAVALLPTGALARSYAALVSRDYATAVALHAYPIATVVALSCLAAPLLAREASQVGATGETAQRGGARERLWTFTNPVVGIAKLHLRALLDSNVGRFGLVMPLLTIFIVKGPLAHAMGRGDYLVPASFSYIALGGMQLQMSLFGLDGHGTKALFLLPISARTILAGKVMGLAAYQLAQVALLTVLLAVVQRTPSALLVAGVLLAATYFLAQVTLGQITSVWMPRAIPRRGARKAGVPLPLLAVGMGSWGALTATVGGAYSYVAKHAPGFLIPAMLATALTAFAGLALSRAQAARYLEENRERVIEAMS